MSLCGHLFSFFLGNLRMIILDYKLSVCFDCIKSIFCLLSLIYAIICLTDILIYMLSNFPDFFFLMLLDFVPCFHGIPYTKVMLLLSFETTTFLVILDESNILQYIKLICIF